VIIIVSYTPNLGSQVDLRMQMPEPLAVIELKDHGTPRHLHAFLGLYVPMDHFQGDRAYRRNELQARPDAGQTLLQP
jgi:hypothetical protein